MATIRAGYKWVEHASSVSSMKMEPTVQTIPDMVGRLLYFACLGDVNAVREILDDGLLVDSADYDGRTAMHLAACEGHSRVVELLLKREARVDLVDRWGDTPLSAARRCSELPDNRNRSLDFTNVCELLVAHGGKFPNIISEYEIDPEELPADLFKFPKFKVLKPIGEGSFGQVFLVNWRGTNVAAKMIQQRLAQDEKIVKEFRMELALLQRLRHPNIVQFLGAVTKEKPLVIITEYLPNGDLDDIIKRKGRIQPKEAVRYALDIARGMNYLHREAIVHRDLKPRNLLQDAAGHLKVADFGLSKLLESNAGRTGNYEMTGETGSYRYMAPEVFLHDYYDKSVDVFSFAIIVQEMFDGCPNDGTDEHDVASSRALSNRRPEFFAKTYPPDMQTLLRECWHQNPKMRPTFGDIIPKLESMLEGLKRTPLRWAPKLSTSLSQWYQRCQINRPGLTSSVIEQYEEGQDALIRRAGADAQF